MKKRESNMVVALPLWAVVAALELRRLEVLLEPVTALAAGKAGGAGLAILADRLRYTTSFAAPAALLLVRIASADLADAGAFALLATLTLVDRADIVAERALLGLGGAVVADCFPDSLGLVAVLIDSRCHHFDLMAELALFGRRQCASVCCCGGRRGHVFPFFGEVISPA
jgi:hypothetical protein